MKKLLFTLLAMFASVASYSQQLIAVEFGGNSTFYTDLDTALAQAPDGATMYLPGITFSKPSGSYLIDKKLNII